MSKKIKSKVICKIGEKIANLLKIENQYSNAKIRLLYNNSCASCLDKICEKEQKSNC